MRCHVRHAFLDDLPFRSRIPRLPCASFRSCPPVPPPRRMRRTLHMAALAPPTGRPARRDPVLRANRVRARAQAGGRFAPARFARLIARASQRTHFPRPFPPGFPAPAALCRKRKRRPRKPPFPHPSYTTFPQVKPPAGRFLKIFLRKGSTGLRDAASETCRALQGLRQGRFPAIAARSPPPASRTGAGRPGSAPAPRPGLSCAAGRSHGRSCGIRLSLCFS